MVGVPRSKGCKTCVQRRVKCDETRPFCINCTKGGRHCPGYKSQVIFRDEGPRLRRQHAETSTVESHNFNNAVDDTSERSATLSPDATVLLDSHREARQQITAVDFVNAEHVSKADFQMSRTISPDVDINDRSSIPDIGLEQWDDLPLHRSLYAPTIHQRQLLQGFSESVAPTTKDFLPSIMKTQWVWLRHLPDLCGTNPLLDAAMRAVTLVQIGRRHQVDAMVTESRPHYGTALRLLSQALTQPEAGVSSNTLCATALLSYYEMFASSDDASWIRHAGGVGALMRQRGAERHRFGFGREILRAYRYTLVIEAFQKGQSCLLYEPQWRKVLVQIHEDIRTERLIPDERMVLFDAGEAFFYQSTETTHLCAETRVLLSGGISSDAGHPRALARHLEKLKQNQQAMKNSHALFEQGLKDARMMPTTHLTDDPVFPVQIIYGNLFMSIFYAGYRSTLSVVNLHIIQIIRALVQDGTLPTTELIEYMNENRYLSTQLCQSVSYMLRSSFLGPFHAVFGLRLASQVFRPGERKWDWTIGKLYEIASNNLMMARHLPWYDKEGRDREELELAVDRSRKYLTSVSTRPDPRE